MKKLAFIMLLSAFSMGTTFSQPYVADLNYVDRPEEYFLGCGLIEFEWSISFNESFGAKDAQSILDPVSMKLYPLYGMNRKGMAYQTIM